MVLPFLYFPMKFEKTLAVITGLALIIGSYRTKDTKSDDSSKKESVPFVEHKSEPAVTSVTGIQSPVEPQPPLNISSTDQPPTQ